MVHELVKCCWRWHNLKARQLQLKCKARLKGGSRLRDCWRQSQLDVNINSRNKILETWGPPYPLIRILSNLSVDSVLFVHKMGQFLHPLSLTRSHPSAWKWRWPLTVIGEDRGRTVCCHCFGTGGADLYHQKIMEFIK